MAAITQKNNKTPTPVTSADAFTSAFLAGIGAPDNANNHTFVIAWMGGESTNAANNPLATTQPANGATAFNTLSGGGHVWNYPNPQTGLAATIQTIKNGYYPGLLSNLQSGNLPPQQIIDNNAGELGTWGTGASLVSTRLAQLQQGQLTSAQVAPGLTGAPSGGGGGSWYGGIVSGAESAGSTALGAVTNPVGTATGLLGSAASGLSSALGLDKIGKDIIYAVAILGGGLIMLAGIVLVGADLGLSVLASRNPVVSTARKATTRVSRGSNYKQGQRQAQAAQERKAGRQSQAYVHEGAANNRSDVERKARIRREADKIPNDDIPF